MDAAELKLLQIRRGRIKKYSWVFDCLLKCGVWECESCHAVHDRDENVTQTILAQGRKIVIATVGKSRLRRQDHWPDITSYR